MQKKPNICRSRAAVRGEKLQTEKWQYELSLIHCKTHIRLSRPIEEKPLQDQAKPMQCGWKRPSYFKFGTSATSTNLERSWKKFKNTELKQTKKVYEIGSITDVAERYDAVSTVANAASSPYFGRF